MASRVTKPENMFGFLILIQINRTTKIIVIDSNCTCMTCGSLWVHWRYICGTLGCFMGTLWVHWRWVNNYRYIMGSLWVHLGYIMGPLWVHWGSLWVHWVHWGYIMGLLWVHWGYIMCTYMYSVLSECCCCVLCCSFSVSGISEE